MPPIRLPLRTPSTGAVIDEVPFSSTGMSGGEVVAAEAFSVYLFLFLRLWKGAFNKSYY